MQAGFRGEAYPPGGMQERQDKSPNGKQLGPNGKSSAQPPTFLLDVVIWGARARVEATLGLSVWEVGLTCPAPLPGRMGNRVGKGERQAERCKGACEAGVKARKTPRWANK